MTGAAAEEAGAAVGPAHATVRRYFEMWNSGDISIAPDVLCPDWTDHAHPDLAGVADVQSAVTRIRTARPGLRFHVETVLGSGDELLSVVGGVGDASRPGVVDSHLVWLVRLRGGRMAEMWTYRRTSG
ncbi:nuclear transport factor 2 family protein [Streptomyces sp. NRRL F-5123]|uniref:nuclear transport factor 2 family protein n=1 Tax=Streptomyces sp. NRRL F-5123 TaxID=1463856 RepID=UPI0004E159AF|nr:nuclear transport factor 2 family protein [Streptomyces sp. NRRL F-5123]